MLRTSRTVFTPFRANLTLKSYRYSWQIPARTLAVSVPKPEPRSELNLSTRDTTDHAALVLPKALFSNTQHSYAALPTTDLLRAWLVLKLCSFPLLVNHAQSLLSTARAAVGDTAVRMIVKPVFFDHFCAGETETELQPKVDFLAKNGIGAILDFAVEADIGTAQEDMLDSGKCPLGAVLY